MMRSALSCFHEARALDPDLDLPQAEIDEMIALIDWNADTDGFPVPRPDGMGFRRHKRPHSFTGGWELILPGYFYVELDEDEATAIHYYADRTVNVTSLSYEGKTVGSDHFRKDGVTFVDEVIEPNYFGVAEQRTHGDGNEAYHDLSCRFAASNNTLLFVTVSFDSADDLGWALEVFRSVRNRPDSDMTEE